jgi:hypothetical protein
MVGGAYLHTKAPTVLGLCVAKPDDTAADCESADALPTLGDTSSSRGTWADVDRLLRTATVPKRTRGPVAYKGAWPMRECVSE